MIRQNFSLPLILFFTLFFISCDKSSIVIEMAPNYTIIYNGNGNTSGTIPVDTTHYKFGDSVVVQSNLGNLSKNGFLFAGWNTQSDGLGVTYTQNQSILMSNSNILLFAIWKKAEYTVTYSGNENTAGIVPTDLKKYASGDTVITQPNLGNLTKTNDIFTGWNTEANGSGITYFPNQKFTMNIASVILYAKWEKNEPMSLVVKV